MKHREHILVAFSGSANCLALLRLLADGLDESTHKKLILSVSVVIIDETVLFSKEETSRVTFIQEVVNKARAFPFPVFLSSLERCLKEHDFESGVDIVEVRPDGKYDLSENVSWSRKLKDLFVGTTESSAKETLLRHLKRRLLTSSAKCLGVVKVFTAESSTTLSVELMSGKLQYMSSFDRDEKDGEVAFRDSMRAWPAPC